MNELRGSSEQGEKIETSAIQVMKRTSHVDELAKSVASMLCDKLKPVMRTAGPAKPDKTNEELLAEYPPLFAQWYKHIASIRASLLIIEDAIRRTEL